MTPDQIAGCIILTMVILYVLFLSYKDLGLAAASALGVSALSIVGLVWQLAILNGGA